jgi:hypothetical protein
MSVDHRSSVPILIGLRLSDEATTAERLAQNHRGSGIALRGKSVAAGPDA